ncbi:DUF2214 family protein [Pannonibacter indicus]|uniref:Uncharacterized membrane protein n=1 Tax=Pannonibacter indicus TaxID=466044 RepID=A0A0K6I3Q2_9HYPH|nr:DUF2214 family protein [Pannonibacter indicus]CUA97706.1 Uncharacterized membrane protein [Pannonibacter indicus]
MADASLLLSGLVLAGLHHLAVFALFAVLVMELAICLRQTLASEDLKRLALLDLHYGALAVLVLLAGGLRVMYGGKGADYYLENLFFWAKMGIFLAIGLISILPTLRILSWRRQLKADPAFVPPAAGHRLVRRALVAELLLFPLLPLFAAAMAQGYGL